jgi:heat shock protein HtpX
VLFTQITFDALKGIRMNSLRTTILMAALTILLMMVGRVLGGTGGMFMAFIFAFAMNFGAYWFSDKLILRMTRARELGDNEGIELRNMVAQLAQRAQMPMPKVYVIEDATPNAFATGRNPENGVVAVTTGITHILTKDELAGVIAHELAHIKNRDTLISAISATMAGAISMIADMFRWMTIFGGNDEDAPNPIAMIALSIITPLAATLIHMGISRSREYLADAGGAEIHGDPLALANALRKLERGAQVSQLHTSPATASLYIINPFSGGGLLSWFSTHPPTAERIARLEALANKR